jgi:hypothetical protein
MLRERKSLWLGEEEPPAVNAVKMKNNSKTTTGGKVKKPTKKIQAQTSKSGS